MKKGLLLFTFVSFLFLGNITVYSQDNIENQNDIEILDNIIDNLDNIDDKKKDKKTTKEKKEKVKEKN